MNERETLRLKFLEAYHHWSQSTIGIVKLQIMNDTPSYRIMDRLNEAGDEFDIVRKQYYKDIGLSEEEIAFLSRDGKV